MTVRAGGRLERRRRRETGRMIEDPRGIGLRVWVFLDATVLSFEMYARLERRLVTCRIGV